MKRIFWNYKLVSPWIHPLIGIPWCRKKSKQCSWANGYDFISGTKNILIYMPFTVLYIKCQGEEIIYVVSPFVNFALTVTNKYGKIKYIRG